jgi:cytochrome c551/c552
MQKIKTLSIIALSTALVLGCSKKEETPQTQAPTQTQQQPQQTAQPQPSESTQAQQEQKPAEKQTEETKKEEPKKESAVAKVDGESIFKSKGCTACHQANADTVGPGLNKIASAYKGNKDGLIKYFNGEGKAIVDPTKEAIMKPQIEITKKLSKEEKEALADFILKH